jgi:hypothetical protein
LQEWTGNAQDLFFEDVDRIEVIRGPGGTIWSSNAVNRVINIITKNTKDTRRGLITTSAGNADQSAGGIRYGVGNMAVTSITGPTLWDSDDPRDTIQTATTMTIGNGAKPVFALIRILLLMTNSTFRVIFIMAASDSSSVSLTSSGPNRGAGTSPATACMKSINAWRWLLMSHDRVRTNTIALTQDFFVQMLGISRQLRLSQLTFFNEQRSNTPAANHHSRTRASRTSRMRMLFGDWKTRQRARSVKAPLAFKNVITIS